MVTSGSSWACRCTAVERVETGRHRRRPGREVGLGQRLIDRGRRAIDRRLRMGSRLVITSIRIQGLCAYDPRTCSGVRRILIRAVASHYKRNARDQGHCDPRVGCAFSWRDGTNLVTKSLAPILTRKKHTIGFSTRSGASVKQVRSSNPITVAFLGLLVVCCSKDRPVGPRKNGYQAIAECRQNCAGSECRRG